MQFRRHLPSVEATRQPEVHTGLVISVVFLGIMITAIDSTIVVLGLPTITADLHSSIIMMVWIILAYLLTITVLTTQLGRLGDLYGRVNIYTLGFGVFTIGSILCGIAQSDIQLIAFRVVQAVGGAMITSNSGAIVADNVPAHRRGTALGWTSVGWNVGAVFGILLGGVLITYLGWRSIFYINVPIGAVAIVGSRLWLKERSARIKRKLDIAGAVTLGIGLFLLLWALTSLAGGFSLEYLIVLLLGLVFLGAFAWVETVTDSPIVSVQLLRVKVLAASFAASFFQGLGNFAVLFLLIMYLQGARGFTPLESSLYLVPGYLVGAAMAPFGGRISDKLGARLPASAGILFQIIAILIYLLLSLRSPIWVVMLGSIVSGLGSGLFYPANNSAVIANSPRESYGFSSGFLRMVQNIGMVTSFALALFVASQALPRYAAYAIFIGTSKLNALLAPAFLHGMKASLTVCIALQGVALLFSLARGKEDRKALGSQARNA
jgi:EmrB/QacA subfamily drug resistance transporter